VPGFSAVLCDEPAEACTDFVTGMLDALMDDASYLREQFAASGVALGSVRLPVVSPHSQLAWNEDRSRCAVFEGELYGTSSIRAGLEARGHRFACHSFAELVLRLYERDGEDYAAGLNGAFAAAIWDKRANTLVVATDRLGLQPVYYAEWNERVLVGTGMRALLAHRAFPRRLDMVGVGQFLVFDQLLGDRTLLRDIRLLEPATVLTVRRGRSVTRQYWQPPEPRLDRVRAEREYVEEFSTKMVQACHRQAPSEQPGAVLLSGGLDSRIIAAFLKQSSPDNALHAFTFGIPGCDDARFAREVANTLEIPNRFFELKPTYLTTLAEKAVRVTDGQQNCIHMHAMATLDGQAEVASTFYKGFMGEALFGWGIHLGLWGAYRREDFPRILHSELASRGLLVFESGLSDVLSHDLAAMDTCVTQSFAEALKGCLSTDLADAFTRFYLQQRGRRLTLNGVLLVRARGRVRLPLCDNDVVECGLQIPPGLRADRRFAVALLALAFPKLAKIPST
jgi:asparagine synthase (glutamine-hydrolysing)